MNPDHRHSVLTFPTPEALAEAAADRVVRGMLARPGPVAVCLTGGSSPYQLYRLLGSDPYQQRIPWERVHWFIGDERFVPDRDPLHNMAVARRLFLDDRAPASHIHPIPTELSNPDQAARIYESELQAFYGDNRLASSRPLFDVVLLGLGPDGHVASLFPGQSALEETTRWTVGVPEAAVSPFVPRVTLTLPALNSSAEMLFLVAGKEKRGILSRVLSGEDLPANRCRATGRTIWLVDQAAHPDDVIDRE